MGGCVVLAALAVPLGATLRQEASPPAGVVVSVVVVTGGDPVVVAGRGGDTALSEAAGRP